MNTIKAIETRYAGYRFRSRLEARWAIFFDALGLQWEYEPEGFETDVGWYLPDFRVVNDIGQICWIEVKPLGVKRDPKFEAFSKKMPHYVLVSGDPATAFDLANDQCMVQAQHAARFARFEHGERP